MGRSPRIKVSSPGTMRAVGYTLSKKKSEREKALKKAVKKYGYSTAMKRVNALYVFNKNNPAMKRKLTSDKEYLKSLREKSNFGFPKEKKKLYIGLGGFSSCNWKIKDSYLKALERKYGSEKFRKTVVPKLRQAVRRLYGKKKAYTATVKLGNEYYNFFTGKWVKQRQTIPKLPCLQPTEG